MLEAGSKETEAEGDGVGRRMPMGVSETRGPTGIQELGTWGQVLALLVFGIWEAVTEVL